MVYLCWFLVQVACAVLTVSLARTQSKSLLVGLLLACLALSIFGILSTSTSDPRALELFSVVLLFATILATSVRYHKHQTDKITRSVEHGNMPGHSG